MENRGAETTSTEEGLQRRTGSNGHPTGCDQTEGGLPTTMGKGGRQLQDPSCSDLPPLPASAKEHHSATPSSTTTVREDEEGCPSSTHCSLLPLQEPT